MSQRLEAVSRNIGNDKTNGAEIVACKPRADAGASGPLSTRGSADSQMRVGVHLSAERALAAVLMFNFLLRELRGHLPAHQTSWGAFSLNNSTPTLLAHLA